MVAAGQSSLLQRCSPLLQSHFLTYRSAFPWSFVLFCQFHLPRSWWAHWSLCNHKQKQIYTWTERRVLICLRDAPRCNYRVWGGKSATRSSARACAGEGATEGRGQQHRRSMPACATRRGASATDADWRWYEPCRRLLHPRMHTLSMLGNSLLNTYLSYCLHIMQIG